MAKTLYREGYSTGYNEPCSTAAVKMGSAPYRTELYCLSSSFAIAQSSSWKVGRGAISGSRAGSGLSLKISLRNVGAPASDTVTIMGRWSRSQPGKRSISGSELASFVELGVFTRAFAMKQTVILELELAPLGFKPSQMRAIEIAIVTDNRVTDGAVISTNY